MEIPRAFSPLIRASAALYCRGVACCGGVRKGRRDTPVRTRFGVATLLILVLTLLHWADFMAIDAASRGLAVDYGPTLYGADSDLRSPVLPSRHGSTTD